MESNERTRATHTSALLVGAVALSMGVSVHADARMEPATGTATEGATATEAAPTPRFEGSYRLAVPPDSARQAIDEAIEIGIQGMGAIRKPIARRRLKARNSVIQSVSFHQGPDRIVVQLDDQRFEAPADGRRVPTRLKDGEEIELSHRIQNDRLVQTFVGEDGQRITVYHLRPDGEALRVYTTVESGQLPSDVKYMLPYARAR